MRASYMFIAVVACAAASTPALAAGVMVQIDQSTPVRLSGSASQVVVSNPSIADATLLDRHQVVLSGRNYGTTSVMVFDAAGRAIYNGVVTVGAPSTNHVSFYRGPVVHNFTCVGHCERTAMPGEPDSTYKTYSSAARDYADRAKSAAGGDGGGTP